MAQNININPISIGSSHDSSTTYTFTVDSGTVTLFGGDPATGITKAALEAGIIITVSDDSLIYATCTVDNGTCQGQTSIVYWFNGVVGTWQTGGNLSFDRIEPGGAGEQPAALAFGGTSYSPSAGSLRSTEAYDGSVWSTRSDLIRENSYSGTGAQNAALAVSIRGNYSNGNLTEEYNGSTWSIGGNLLVTKLRPSLTGVQNAALAVDKDPTPNAVNITRTEEYNGGVWSTSQNTITIHNSPMGVGSVNSTLIYGGYCNATCTEEYDGITWSSKSEAPKGICEAGSAGVSNNALFFGGLDGVLNLSSTSLGFDGSSWSICNGLINGRYKLQGIGSKTGMAIGGGFPTRNQTEEYSPLFTTTSIPTPPPTGTTPPSGVGVWSSAADFQTPRTRLAGTGEQNSALIFGGDNFPTTYSCTEAYDGITWSTKSPLNLGRYGLGGAGTQNASLAMGGGSPSNSTGNSEIYDGISWTTVDSLNQPRTYGAGIGTQNEALYVAGGYNGFYCDCVEQYDGISWTNSTTYPDKTQLTAGAGTQNYAVFVGGTSNSRQTRKFDGNVWSNGNNANFITCAHSSAGTAQNYALAFAGYTSCTEEYSGDVWTIGGTFTTDTRLAAGAGTQAAALKMGGTGGTQSVVEKYNK